MSCKFASPCKHYKRDSYTCNNDSGADGFCVFYRQFKSIKPRIITV